MAVYSPTAPFSEYLLGEQIKYPQLDPNDIQTLKNSLENNKKLPFISDKKYLAFLHSCNFDVELAKKTVQKRYSYCFDIPQVFCQLDPLAEDIEDNYNCVSVCQMPTDNLNKGNRILYLQFKDPNSDKFDYVSLFKYLDMWMEYVLLTYGTCDGIVVVVNTKGLSWRHIMKLPITIATKMLKYLECGLPVRLKEIHVLHTGTYAQMILKLIMKFANKELIDKIIVHTAGSEDIFKYVPKNIMPAEMGGLGKSHTYYNDKLYNDMIEIRDLFLEEKEVLNNQMNYIHQQHFLEKE